MSRPLRVAVGATVGALVGNALGLYTLALIGLLVAAAALAVEAKR